MKIKTDKILKNIIMLSCLTVSVTNANSVKNMINIEEVSITTMETMPLRMSTTQLEQEVEKLTSNDKLYFEIGMELIKRWTAKN